MNLDKYYRKLLFFLTKNARMPLNQLAKAINLSPSTTGYRIKQLEQQGVIQGTYAIIDFFKLGFFGYRMYVCFQATTPDREEEIFSWLQNQSAVAILLQTAGDTDCVCMSWCASDMEYNSFIRRFKELFHSSIKKIEISPYIKAHHLQRNYLVSQSDVGILTIGASRTVVDCTQTDLALVRLLSSNARLSALEISQAVSVHVQTVLNRIQYLEKNGVIAGYSASISVPLLQRSYEKLNIVFSQPVNRNEVLSFAANIPESIYVDEAINDYDLELNLELCSVARKNEIIASLKQHFGGFRTLHQFSTTGFRKITYFPEGKKYL